MAVRQYVYFGLFSERVSAAEMTAWLGVEPDASTVRGSRRSRPMLPVRHAWKIECREDGLPVDEQISRVLAWLRPHLDKIVELSERLSEEEPANTAVLQVVRYFNDEADSPDTDPSVETTDRPNLFGWHLDHDILAFMSAVGAVLDVDEYDLS
ncbi:DUF4279 domain-containing protein [Actinocorallia populi]|uniref:DUF4279 domain-containing protein n=1 Tax=Actinocorallia populi TaxID=2079200 RepID=UPI000D090951|nr:DUF4279 domain-containing protein [Actinocorallia populi]